MAGPKYRVVASSKEKGEEITFTDHRGETVTKKYAPFGTIWEGDNGLLSFKFEKNLLPALIKNREDYWFNVYENDNNGGASRGGTKAAAQRKTKDDSRDTDDDF